MPEVLQDGSVREVIAGLVSLQDHLGRVGGQAMKKHTLPCMVSVFETQYVDQHYLHIHVHVHVQCVCFSCIHCMCIHIQLKVNIQNA